MLLFLIFCSVACLHLATRLECLIVSHLLILCSICYLCQPFLCSASHFFCFVLKQVTWLILGFLLLLPVNLLRHPAILHCCFLFGILMYLCQAFYCVSVIFMCKAFYYVLAILCCVSYFIFFCSHFMLS
jgi:hypothetical protein